MPIATFIGAAIAAWATLAQARTAWRRHQEQTTADRERRITESFAKAVEQLGSDDKLETRLGGIYTLERIAAESEREYWPIMEMLTTYVRRRSPWPLLSHRPPPVRRPPTHIPTSAPEWDHAYVMRVEEPEPEIEILPETDIQAVLTILGRRDETARKRDEAAKRHLNLRRSDLRGAALWGAHLEHAHLWEAHLEYAYLGQAHLEHAHLEGAHLEGAYLRGAVGLTQQQLESAFGDDCTALPEGLAWPAHWPAVLPDKSDNSQ